MEGHFQDCVCVSAQIGFQAQRRFIVGDRFLRPALGVEGIPEIVGAPRRDRVSDVAPFHTGQSLPVSGPRRGGHSRVCSAPRRNWASGAALLHIGQWASFIRPDWCAPGEAQVVVRLSKIGFPGAALLPYWAIASCVRPPGVQGASQIVVRRGISPASAAMASSYSGNGVHFIRPGNPSPGQNQDRPCAWASIRLQAQGVSSNWDDRLLDRPSERAFPRHCHAPRPDRVSGAARFILDDGLLGSGPRRSRHFPDYWCATPDLAAGAAPLRIGRLPP